MPRNPVYVPHDCKNPDCNVRWVAKDDCNVSSRPPTSKYCPDCVEWLGFTNKKDTARVERGKALARKAKESRDRYDTIKDLL